jgi:hypothetical protein
MKIAAAGASVHGASPSVATFTASCSIVPRVAIVLGNGSPTLRPSPRSPACCCGGWSGRSRCGKNQDTSRVARAA